MRFAALLLAGALAIAQAPLQFEVASVKPSPPYDPRGVVGAMVRDGRFLGIHVSLANLVQFAYQLPDYQVTGGPAWIHSRDVRGGDMFHVDAKPSSNSATTAQIRQMVQALLAERFQLRFHRETRDIPVFALTVSPGGSKMKPDTAGTPDFVGTQEGLEYIYKSSAEPLQALLGVLRFATGRPVLDRTGLTGTYAYTLRFAAGNPPPPEANAPSIFTAVDEQLGLKLEAVRAPYEVLVIDGAERPSAN